MRTFASAKLATLTAATGLLLLAAFAFALPALDSPVPDADPNAKKKDELYMLFSVNNVGYIDVCGCKKKKLRQGSITRRSSWMKQLRARGRKLLVVDGGNTLFGTDDPKAAEHTRKNLIEKAKVIIEGYNRMDYKVMNVGHLDLTMGLDQLKEFEKMAKFPFICANFAYEESGELVFAPTAEIEVHGIKVGFLGLIHQQMQPSFFKKRAPGTVVLDGIEQAKKFVPGLRERNDLVIVMSYNHLDHHTKLVEALPEIDIIIDPYLDAFGGMVRGRIDEEDYVTKLGDVLLPRTRPEGHSIGTVDMRLVKGSGRMLDAAEGEVPPDRSSYMYKREKIEPHMLHDPDIDRLVEAYKKGTFVNTPRIADMPDKDKYLTISTCQACHVEQYKFWEKTDHSKAFATLEESDDQWRQECIGCHTLGYGAAFVHPDDSPKYQNVQCESCHGLNPKHPTDPKKYDWPRVKEMDCLKCHNKSQTREDFKYAQAKRKVACPKMKR